MILKLVGYWSTSPVVGSVLRNDENKTDLLFKPNVRYKNNIKLKPLFFQWLMFLQLLLLLLLPFHYYFDNFSWQANEIDV